MRGSWLLIVSIVYLFSSNSVEAQEIGDLVKRVESLELTTKERLGKVKTSKELSALLDELTEQEEGRLEKLIEHEDKLKSTLGKVSLFELNRKIDEVVIYQTDDELIARATSFSEINTVLTKLKQIQSKMTKEFTERQKQAAIRVAEVEANLNNKKAQIDNLKAAAEKYEKAKAGEMKDVDTRLAEVMKRVAGKVDLRKEQEVELLERLLDRMEALEAENAKLAKQVAKKKSN